MIPYQFFYIVGVVWIFLIWSLWMIVKSIRGLDTSLQGVNATLKEISERVNKG